MVKVLADKLYDGEFKTLGLIFGAVRTLVFLLISSGAVYALDPGIPDTVLVDSVEGLRGGRANVAVRIINDENIAGITLVLKYEPQYLTLDTFLLDGGVVADFQARIINIRRLDEILEAAAFSTDQTTLLPGSGLLGVLQFSIDPAAPPGVYGIDSTSIVIGPGAINKTLFSPPDGSESIFPQFAAGQISVPEFQATSDSIWVVPAIGAQGQSVSVEFHLFNETELVEIRLPFTYSSADLQFDSVSFAGARGILALNRQTQSNSDSLQVLITLAYSDSAPLSPGTGALARAHFTISNTATVGDIPIDTVAFLGLVRLQLRSSAAAGDFFFTPLFTPGTVTIDILSDVGHDNNPLLPETFALSQNYPNPFNPTTTIEFSLPRLSQIRLSLYNTLGQEVAVIARGRFSAGEHRVSFDAASASASALSSGIYFYRLEANGQSLTRKMALLK